MNEPARSEPTFEEALAKLERVVAELEEGALGLVPSLERYEEGIRCLQQCQRTLEQAERKVELLAGVDAQGQPVVRPLEDEALSLEEKAAARSRRRSRTTRSTDASGTGADSDENSSSPAGGTERGAAGESIDRGKRLF